MRLTSSLPAETPHQKPTGKLRIRVQNSASHGGYGMTPNAVMERIIKELQGARLPVFLLVWKRTIGFRKLEREIPFPEFVENISYGDRTIRQAIRWLEENGWLSVRKNGSRPSIYGIAMQVLEEAHCLAYLLTDGGESPSVSPVAKVAKLNSPPPCIPPKDLRSLNNNTHSTPVATTTGNGPEPDPERGYEGYDVPQPEIPEQESEDRYRTRFDPHAEIREPEPEREYEGYVVSQPEIQIPNHPVAHKLEGCRLHPRNIVKIMRQREPERIMAIVRNFEQDMGKPNNVKPEDYPKVLWWRLREDVTSWEVDSWVADVQQEFDESVVSDRTSLLGVVEFAAKEQNLPVGEVLAKLQLAGITYEQMKKWAAVEMGVGL